ncbi:MAG: thermonuclease family protein [Acidobacteria bacterium]|nr:thermonuclease family protein [Acidobacteriota bacterium]
MIATLFTAGCGSSAEQVTRSGRVGRVVDGDTIVVEGVGTVRYIGIDTPELHHPRKPVERFAARAAQMNRDLVGGRTVRLVTDVEERDVHGRLLAYVYVGGVMVNARLVALGAAEQFPYPPNTLHRAEFARLERQAMRARRGQWGAAEGGPPWGAVSPAG